MDGERRRHETDGLIQAALAVASESEPASVLRRLLDLLVDLTEASGGAIISLDPDGRVCDFVASDPSWLASWPAAPADGILGDLLRDQRPVRLHGVALQPDALGFAAHQPPIGSLLGGRISAMGRSYGCVYLVDKRGHHDFTEDDEMLLVAMAAQAGVALANFRLLSDARLHMAWRDAIDRVMTAALTGPDTADVLGEVARAARAMADADLVLVIGTGGGHSGPRVLAADGTAASRLLGAPARRRAPARQLVADVSLQDPPVSHLPGMAAAIAAPMRARGPACETLWVMRALPRPPFDATTAGLVESFGDVAAGMLDQVRSRQHGERPAPPDDRERLADDLHDDVVQTLFGVGMEIEAAAQRAGHEELAALLRGTASTLDWVIDRVRHHHDGAAPKSA